MTAAAKIQMKSQTEHSAERDRRTARSAQHICNLNNLWLLIMSGLTFEHAHLASDWIRSSWGTEPAPSDRAQPRTLAGWASCPQRSAGPTRTGREEGISHSPSGRLMQADT